MTTTSTAYVDLAGSSETFIVPTGETARIYAIFSAESACYGGGADCGSAESASSSTATSSTPPVGTDFAFDSTDDGDEGTSSPESHAIARPSETLSAGNHTRQGADPHAATRRRRCASTTGRSSSTGRSSRSSWPVGTAATSSGRPAACEAGPLASRHAHDRTDGRRAAARALRPSRVSRRLRPRRGRRPP